ncbi:hypothetical protein OG555_10440 [Kribbella sp. NBC_01484]|uniref:hypothetical protein n=1 Tax=Kribbella sp. NBC_01484 TaxID=2903579 RepID=UPI002E348D19|nr:hypothetical protein [Kribbella sp. NBC_01484]
MKRPITISLTTQEFVVHPVPDPGQRPRGTVAGEDRKQRRGSDEQERQQHERRDLPPARTAEAVAGLP